MRTAPSNLFDYPPRCVSPPPPGITPRRVRPTNDELRENATEHGVRLANYVAQRIELHSIDPGSASKFLRVFIVAYAREMAELGASHEELITWSRAVQTAFDVRLAACRDLTTRSRVPTGQTLLRAKSNGSVGHYCSHVCFASL